MHVNTLHVTGDLLHTLLPYEMQGEHSLVRRGHYVKVANKILTEQLHVVEHERALVRVMFLYAEEHSYVFFLQRSRVLVRA